MSETKNVVIQQNNGTDYDKLHPETVDSKVNLTGGNVSVWGNTLKDALPKINSRLTVTESNQWEIGDIRTTTKSDLGEKWLKTDGGSYDTSKYPELSKVTEVRGFPFGTCILKKIASPPRKKLFSAANGGWDRDVPFAEINGYYIRTSDLKKDRTNKKISFTIYYSVDFQTWQSNDITFNCDKAASETVNGLLVGYENRYYYFSFTSSNGCFFIYSFNINEKNWTVVDIGLNVNWSGQIFYYNNKWRIYYLSYTDYYDAFAVYKRTYDSINFSSFTEIRHGAARANYIGDIKFSCNVGNTVYLIYETERLKSGVYKYDGSNLFCVRFESNNTNTNGFGICSSTQYLEKILKNSNNFALYYGSNNKYVINLNRNILTSIESEQCQNNIVPDFINKKGEYCYYIENTSMTIYTSISPSFSRYTTQNSPYWENELGTAVFAFLEVSGGVFFGTVSTSQQKFGKISFDGVLPNYNPTSSSPTKLNTFIKALD